MTDHTPADTSGAVPARIAAAVRDAAGKGGAASADAWAYSALHTHDRRTQPTPPASPLPTSAEAPTTADNERIQATVVLLSAGAADGCSMLLRSPSGAGDVLVAAQLADSDWPDRLYVILGNAPRRRDRRYVSPRS